MNNTKAGLKESISINLINHFPGIYYRYKPGDKATVIYISQGCFDITGYPPESYLYNQRINYTDLVYEKDREYIQQKRQIKAGVDFELTEEYRIRRADGKIKWVKEIARGLYNKKSELKYIESCVLDIDAERTGSLAVNSLTAYQKAVNTAAIVSITDSKGRIIFANDFFCEISKFTREELIGKTHQLINSKYHKKEFFAGLWKVITSGNIWHGEIKNKTKDGTYYWVDTTISPIFNNDGAIIQYLSIRSLITERKNLEQERENLISELTHKYNELMQFNYIVSHNLRAPIANMISLTRLLSEEGNGCAPEVKMLIEYLSKSVLSVDDVIRDLSQILSARNPIHQKVEAVNLIDIIESVENNLEKQITESGTKIIVDINSKAAHFKSIKSYIQSIIYNLVSNAIKYSNEQIQPVIIIKGERSNRRLRLSVNDNGIGMDLNKVGPQLFGLYKKFNFDKEGRGLGLHMTKTQVESLGGKIEVRSKEGIGSSFTITLPVW
ncbi:PAS domain-containing sensor histidine kinase [Mucilaginibacter sp. BJC16-A38]|uniref:PAS domain-containing sensor histidine kinase n=1 Tax=Mucilaginibacter phenanthrenivorans TaxID=1234842 RepID=UPI0021581494|nr:PAS domain-containing sensor histidine kinase [Mucilaginibacter phenanthrenivorans]MCR8560788.1 PAS domain-containing sensor histidine kinase [Mucilaginibacter phenanthrenivorans]